MAEHAIQHADVQTKPKPGSMGARVIRHILQWGLLAVLLFTCIMAAYRKFGG
jgi:hypothetical protein